MESHGWLSGSVALLDRLNTVAFELAREDDAWTIKNAAGPTEQLLDLTCDQLRGPLASWLSLIHPDDRPSVRRILEEPTEDSLDIVCRVRAPDGEWRWYQHQATPTSEHAWEMLIHESDPPVDDEV